MAFLYFVVFAFVFVLGSYGLARFLRARGHGADLEMIADWMDGSKMRMYRAAAPVARGVFRAQRGIHSLPLFGSKRARFDADRAIAYIDDNTTEKTPGPGQRHV